ncbi:MAG: CHRD domain-containing protein [Dehalococcoidia bacterium]|nr:CHRD domain-containing protein [Dehalococcoidia bacterium]
MRTQPRHLVGLSLLVAGLLAIVLGFARTATAQDAAFETTLHGGNEVPPIASDATGTVAIQFTGDAVDFSLSASGATFTARYRQLGGSGENGDVVAFLFSDGDGTSMRSMSPAPVSRG